MVNKTYYYRGTIIEEANYRKGRKHGRSIDGYALDRYAVSNYRNGKLNGELATYVGETIQTVMHYVDNVEHGRYERYNLSGDLIYEATYRNGKLDGTSNAYDDYGKLINSVVYVDGEVIRVSY
jgi:antitoxin component YwqK of YwqJK toxin-antitoxin module